MYKAKAIELYDEYARRDDARDLSFRQIDAVVDALLKTRFDHPADVDDVAAVVERVCPQESPMMYRPQQSTQQPKQSKEDMNKEIMAFLNSGRWSEVAPRAIPPFDANGQVASAINYNAFAAAVKRHTIYGTGINPVRADILAQIVLGLDQAKPSHLEHYPQVVERVVEKIVEKTAPLTRREEAKQNFKLDKVMNRAESPIKGINWEIAKEPAATQAQLEAQARHDLNENAVMGDVRSVISGHTHSGSHAATKYEREILTNLMNAGIRKNVPAETILANVKAKQDAMSKWGPQQALKELNPQLFTSQPKAGY